MSFNIHMMINSSEENALTKKTTQVGILTGVLREESSILTPSILCEGSVTAYAGCNYFYIPDFKRYYYITDLAAERNNIFRLTGRVDVLMSYADAIKKCPCIVHRQEKNWNLYLNDGSLLTYQNPVVTTTNFPNGFSAQEFILAVAGG